MPDDTKPAEAPKPEAPAPQAEQPAPKPEKHTVASLAERMAEVERTVGIQRDAGGDQG